MKVHTPVNIGYKPPEESREYVRPYVMAFLLQLGVEGGWEFIERQQGADKPQFTPKEQIIAQDVCRQINTNYKMTAMFAAAGVAMNVGLPGSGFLMAPINGMTQYQDAQMDKLHTYLRSDDMFKEAYRLANSVEELPEFFSQMQKVAAETRELAHSL